MKYAFVLTAAALIGLMSISSFADETSAPVPIHRTIARRHVVKPWKKPASASSKMIKPVVKPATSNAK